MRHFKRMLTAAVVLLFLLMLADSIYAQKTTLHLKDGVVLNGQVLMEDKDTYSLAMGDSGGLVVRKADVVSIEEKEEKEPSPPTPTKTTGGCGGVFVEYSIARSDIAAMLSKFVRRVTQDKGMSEVLSDPQLEAMVMRQDTVNLQKNEKFLKILDHPTVKETVLPAFLLKGTVKLLEITYILRRDKEMMEILSDAQLMAAIRERDNGISLSLKYKGKFLKFMNYPAVRKFIDSEVVTWGE